MPSWTTTFVGATLPSPLPRPPGGRRWPERSWLEVLVPQGWTDCPMRSTTTGSISASASWPSCSMRQLTGGGAVWLGPGPGGVRRPP
eukprot:15291632-Alexandrium_andersonii.AAC.1